MTKENTTALATVSEDNRVTQELLLDYLKTMNKGLTDQQSKQFLAVAGAFGLNPWKREVYAVTYKNKDGSTEMSIVTGYETYIKRAELNPNYDGYDIQFKGSFRKGKVTKHGKNGSWDVDALVPEGCVSCVCTVYRKDRAHPTVEEVFFDEYDQGNSMWQSKPRTMLKKVAIVSAFRKAFPFDFGGMPYTNDELPDRMTGADVLNAQGHVEVAVEQEHAPAATAEKAVPLSDKKRTDFLALVSGEANRAGTPAVNALLERFGGVDSICADRNVAKEVAAQLKALPDKGAANETSTESEEDF